MGSPLLNLRNTLRDTMRVLSENDPLRMAGATAFFTSFALPPILIIIVRLLGFLTSQKEMGSRLMLQMKRMLGPESSGSILKAIASFRALQYNVWVTIALFLFLLFVATTLFNVIKNSINQIWSIHRMKGGKLAAGLRSRVFSVGVILLAGLLFLIVQLTDAGRHLLDQSLAGHLGPGARIYLAGILSGTVAVLLNAVWFYVLFIWLPDGKPYWKVVMAGAACTSLLFNAGKWILRWGLNPGRLDHFYGASGAVVLVLLFVFYSSFLLYFGAALIRVLGERSGRLMRLKPHVTRYQLEEEAVD